MPTDGLITMSLCPTACEGSGFVAVECDSMPVTDDVDHFQPVVTYGQRYERGHQSAGGWVFNLGPAVRAYRVG